MSGGAYRKAMESLYGEAQPGDNALQEARDKYARKLWNLYLDAAKKAMPEAGRERYGYPDTDLAKGADLMREQVIERLDALKEPA